MNITQSETSTIQGCDFCGEKSFPPGATTGKLHRCGGCRVTRYCQKKCQKLHWRNGHRDDCKLLSAGRPQAKKCTTVGSSETDNPSEQAWQLLLEIKNLLSHLEIKNLRSHYRQVDMQTYQKLTRAKVLIQQLTQCDGLVDAVRKWSPDVLGEEGKSPLLEGIRTSQSDQYNVMVMTSFCLATHATLTCPQYKLLGIQETLAIVRDDSRVFKAFTKAARLSEVYYETMGPDVSEHEGDLYYLAGEHELSLQCYGEALNSTVLKIMRLKQIVLIMIRIIFYKVKRAWQDGHAMVEHLIAECVDPWRTNEECDGDFETRWLHDVAILKNHVFMLRSGHFATKWVTYGKSECQQIDRPPEDIRVMLGEVCLKISNLVRAGTTYVIRRAFLAVLRDCFEEYSQQNSLLYESLLEVLDTLGDHGSSVVQTMRLHECSPPCRNKQLAMALLDEHTHKIDLQHLATFVCDRPNEMVWTAVRAHYRGP